MALTAKLSSKGQLIIPKTIRRTLSLGSGAQFHVEVLEKKIILELISASSPIDQLYGRYSGTDLLGALEKEHRQEIHHEQKLSF